ncbi:hypothetical protein [Desnuesiella massiliensis]|uniref:hypothetical protein n=1 Tax=Desnuesiella massiliensis TaxID=1650662 RepID=UPI0006E17965|nr:hypothetical protein [Desnuesiella massiliensis]
MKKENKMRKELQIGLVLFFLFSVTNYFFAVPEVIKGILAGLAFSFSIVGIVHIDTYLRLKDSKKRMIR